MAKKQKSFAEKASSGGNKNLVHVKFVKSVPSDREGFWRFNESMISMEKGQNLDATLKQMADEANMVDIEMPEVAAEVAESPVEEAATAEETADEAPEDDTSEASEETPATEADKSE